MHYRLIAENIKVVPIFKIVVLILLQSAFLASPDCFAQIVKPDSLTGSVSLGNAIRYYHDSAGAQSLLYNGVIHKGYTADIQGTVYFMSQDWQNGWIYFDDILFDDVPVLYDQVTDQVITLTPDKIAVSVVGERVGRFFLSGHTFVRMHSEDNSMEGFYDLLRDGKTAVLVKRKKIIHESTSQDGILRRFLSENRYYLRKGDHYFAIRRMKNVLGALSDKKNEIRQLFKDRKLDMKTDPEGALLEIAVHYDKLNNSL